jgi:nucleotide-binding universal stress UspA family protein
MRKLLVPFDNSECASRALVHAIALVRESPSNALVIVTAYEPPIVYGPVSVYLPEEKARAFARQHCEDILKPAVDMAKAAGITFTTEILEGDIARKIVECVERTGCDGIVMGTHGRGAMGKLIMGSVATKVIHLSPVPVTLVR